MDQRRAEAMLHLPFVFVPAGAEAPAAWRAAHPDVVSLPARLVVRGGARRVQFVMPIPAPPPMPPAMNAPTWRRDPAIGLGRWLQEQWKNLFNSERFDETRSKPPTGSRPIKDTPWSGNHDEIKGAIGAAPDDRTNIAPDGTVWGENPDGSRTNHGPAENVVEGSKPEGRRGKDRDDRRRRR